LVADAVTSFAFGETVTLVRRVKTGVDEYHDDVFTTVETTLHNVPAWPTSTREDVDGQATVYDLVTVFLPADTDIDAIDAVKVYEGLYEVKGRTDRFVSPFDGFNPGLPVPLERVTG
jgi:hypothetical protein